ncbi:MAG: type II toxin-antitoxin system RelE/ParE family toxin [Pseudomonadota bacterium]
MTMPRLSIDVTQQQDLDAIYAYTLAAWGAGQAETYIQTPEHGCETFDAAALKDAKAGQPMPGGTGRR